MPRISGSGHESAYPLGRAKTWSLGSKPAGGVKDRRISLRDPLFKTIEKIPGVFQVIRPTHTLDIATIDRWFPCHHAIDLFGSPGLFMIRHRFPYRNGKRR